MTLPQSFPPLGCASLVFVVLVGALGSAPAGATAATPVDEASALMAEGKNADAFNLLAPLEFDRSGDPRFDLLFGYVALESGHPSIAALAFERVLAVEPNNEEARLHLARTYLALNDVGSAQRAFEQLLASKPTERIRVTVGRYLEGIAARNRGERRAQWQTYLEVGGGYDTNATGATSRNPIAIPIDPGQLLLPSTSLRTASAFAGVNAGTTFVYALAPGWSLYAGGDLLFRRYAVADSVDYRLVAGRGGLYRQFGNNTLRLGVNGSNFELDQRSYRNSGGIELEYLRTLTPRTQMSLLGGYSVYRHLPVAAIVEDYDTVTASASLLHVYGDSATDLASLSVDYGHEDDQRDRTDGNRDYYGVRASVQRALGEQASAFAALGYQVSDYDKTNFIFARKREEDQFSASFGMTVNLGSGLSFRPSVSYLSDSSAITLYDYDRWTAQISLHGDFD